MDFDSILGSVIDQGIKFVRYTNDKDDEKKTETNPFLEASKRENPFLDALKPKPSRGLLDQTTSSKDASVQDKLKKADAVGLSFWNMMNAKKPGAGPDYTQQWSDILAR